MVLTAADPPTTKIHHQSARGAAAEGPLPDGPLQETPVVADTTLATEPLAVVTIVLAWCAVGVLFAAVLARRGHEFRYVGPLGFAFGPLLLGVMLANLRWHERTATPVVVREAEELGGDQCVLVAVIGDPSHVTDALPVLRLAESRLGRVEIARPVTFDAARAHDSDDDRRAAARELETAALFLEEFGPGLVLLPGRGVEPVARFIQDRDADVVLVVGDESAQARLCRGRDRRTMAIMTGNRPVGSRADR